MTRLRRHEFSATRSASACSTPSAGAKASSMLWRCVLQPPSLSNAVTTGRGLRMPCLVEFIALACPRRSFRNASPPVSSSTLTSPDPRPGHEPGTIGDGYRLDQFGGDALEALCVRLVEEASEQHEILTIALDNVLVPHPSPPSYLFGPSGEPASFRA